MTDEGFVKAIEGMMQTLYRVSCTQLRCQADREDAVQEALRRAWEKRHALRNDRYLQTWVIRILLNECDRLRRRRTRTGMLPEIVAPEPGAGELKQAMLDLDENLRVPVLLHYIEGCSVEETARIMRIPPGTVKSRLARGRAQLRAMLDEEVFEK